MGRQRPPASGIEALWDLERFLAESSQGHRGLPEVEIGCERRGRELVRLALQAHLAGRGEGDVGPAVVVEGAEGAVRLSHRRAHSRRLLTIFGEVAITRIGYGAPGQASIHPLDAELQLPGRAYSYELSRRLVRAAVCGPFDEAVALIAVMTGVVVPKRSAELIVIDAASDFDSFYAERPESCSKPADGEILVGAIDGKGIPMVKPGPAVKVVRRTKGQKANKKKMATAGAVFSQPPYVRTPTAVLDSLFATAAVERTRQPRRRPHHKRVWASLVSGKDAFIGDVKAEMTRRDPGHALTWVMVTDGERALQIRVGRRFEGVTLVLDLLHVLEKLWKVAHALHPEGSPEAEAFVRLRAERILNGQVSQVVKGLRLIVTKRRLTGVKAKTLLGVAAYYYANRSRMAYHRYLAAGWPIASGSVEGACKNLVRDRMERSGMRWSPVMAEAMLKMRAVYLSDDLDAYWAWHVEQDQQRLHPKGRWRVSS